MINSYLKYLQEDKEELNEFVITPLIFLISYIYKKYVEHKKIAVYCIGTTGIERKKCFLKNKIIALIKAKREILNLKKRCGQFSKNVAKCEKKIDKEVSEIDKEINTLKTKLATI